MGLLVGRASTLVGRDDLLSMVSSVSADYSEHAGHNWVPAGYVDATRKTY